MARKAFSDSGVFIMTEEDSKILSWTGLGKLSNHDHSQVTQIIELIKNSPPSQISNDEILDMENELHRLYHYPETPVANPMKAWLGKALDSTSSAASIATENHRKRPPEVSENLRITLDALDNLLVQNDTIESSKS